MLKLHPIYPTPAHEEASQAFCEYFSKNYDLDAVLLVNSIARGVATRDSCLDIVLLVQPEKLKLQKGHLERELETFASSHPAVLAMNRAGRYADLHPDIIDGDFQPGAQDEAAGPDDFEIQLGNFLVYSVPLWQAGSYLDQLKERWLPYYAEELRRQRLQAVRWFCSNNLAHIPLYLERGLYFQSFDRLYNSYQEFLQALFIARRTYPLAYNKWIREQVEEILELPGLYQDLAHLLEIHHFESGEIGEKAHELEQLLERYAPAA